MGTIFKGFQDEVLVSIFMVGISIFSFLAVSRDAGTVLTGMALTYMMLVVSGNRKYIIQIVGDDKKSKDAALILLFAALGTGAWIIINSLLYGASTGTFTIFNPEIFRAVFVHTNIPILATDPLAVQIIWGVVFPVIESMFLLGVLIIAYNRIVFGKWWDLPVKLDKKTLYKVLWVAGLVGATAAMVHLQTRQGDSWALISDTVFFGLSTVIVYKRRQLIEALSIHGIINNAVLIFSGAGLAALASVGG